LQSVDLNGTHNNVVCSSLATLPGKPLEFRERNRYSPLASEPCAMNVTFDERMLFYELYAALLSYVNKRLNVVTEQFSDSREYMATPPEARAAIRDALYEHRELIDQFVAENPSHLPADRLEIVGSWKNAVVGKFFVLRYLSKYTVFLGSSTGSPKKAYGVLGLADPLEAIIGSDIPKLVATALLPFKGRIIYDGLVSAYSITFGGGIKKSLNEEYREAKEAFGIIASLDGQPATPREKTKETSSKPRKTPATTSGRSASGDAKAIAEEVMTMTDAFCLKFLNQEYADMCRKLTETLARKRPSPLLKGKLETWACGIVRTIGWVNFLDDRKQKPHMKLPLIDQAFGVAESTGQGKSKTIRTMLKIRSFDPKWTLPSLLDENPNVWILEVNGLLMDIRNTPRELQEAAFAKGLIPYIPADRAEAGKGK
jgi:hypothetical protein